MYMWAKSFDVYYKCGCMFRTKYKIQLWRVGWLAWTVWSFRNIFSVKNKCGNLGYLYFLMCLVSQCRHLWWESRSQMVKPNLVKQDVLLWLVTILPLWLVHFNRHCSSWMVNTSQNVAVEPLRTFEHVPPINVTWVPGVEAIHVWCGLSLLLVCSLALERFFSMY